MKNFLYYLTLVIVTAQCVYAAPSAKKISLTLEDAIILAVRENSNVQSSQLNYVISKNGLEIEKWRFHPHVALQAGIANNRYGSSGLATSSSNSAYVQPSISLLSPFGTQATLTGSNTKANYYNTGLSLQISQPLMRGFGKAIVEAALENAKDSLEISKLNIEGTLRTTVTNVINAYLDVMSAEHALQIDKSALLRAKKSVEQTRLYIKAGHKAGNEIVMVEASVASAKTQIANDKNNLMQSRYALYSAIGIDPNSNIDIKMLDVDALIKKYKILTKEEAKEMILKNDIQYQVDYITLNGSTSRSLMMAEDNTRWQLSVDANVSTQSGQTGNINPGPNPNASSLNRGAYQNQTIGLTLKVPIDDQPARQAAVNARIAMQEAELNLRTEKWAKETSAITTWNQVIIAKDTRRYAMATENLQEKTYNVSYKKYLHGLIDSLELQSAQSSLIQAQQYSLNARIGYLKTLVNLDMLTGNTLKTWDVKVRL